MESAVKIDTIEVDQPLVTSDEDATQFLNLLLNIGVLPDVADEQFIKSSLFFLEVHPLTFINF